MKFLGQRQRTLLHCTAGSMCFKSAQVPSAPAPSPMEVIWSTLSVLCTHSGSVSQLRNSDLMILRNHSSLTVEQTNLLNLCPRGRHLFYYPGQQNNLFTAPESDTLYTSIACFMHILKQLSRTNTGSVSVQKTCRNLRAMGNCFSTIIHAQ